MVDPIEEISVIAVEKGLPLHVDSCIGGFMLPWYGMVWEWIVLPHCCCWLIHCLHVCFILLCLVYDITRLKMVLFIFSTYLYQCSHLVSALKIATTLNIAIGYSLPGARPARASHVIMMSLLLAVILPMGPSPFLFC